MSENITNAENKEHEQAAQANENAKVETTTEQATPDNTQNIATNTTESPTTQPVESPAPEAAAAEATEAKPSEEASQSKAEESKDDGNSDIADKAELGVTAEATAKMEEALKAEPTPEELAAREELEKAAAAKKEEDRKNYQAYKELKGNGETFLIEVIAKVRGGLRVEKDGFQMFLPTSLLSPSRVEDSELDSYIGKKMNVEVADADDERESIVVSRKAIVEREAWEKLNVGDVVKGQVTSVPSFGVFVDLGGVEGLLHVSRISHQRVENPSDRFKKGDEVEVKIIEINKKKGNISLSRKELEDSPWKGASEEFKEGSSHKGKVRNLTNFGIYVEMKPGVDGLIRMNELSWTRRVGRAEDMYKTGDEVEFYVIGVNEEKGQADLSIKRLTDNPWEDVAEKYKIGTEHKGKVNEVVEKGVRISVNDEIDAFMPKGRMRSVLKNGVIPYTQGQEVEVVVIDLDADKQSMILSPKGEQERQSGGDSGFGGGDRGGRRGGARKGENIPKEHDGKQSGSFSLGDMLGNLFGGKDEE